MNNPIDLIHALEHEPELALMVSQPPIAFHRTLVAFGRAVQLNHGMFHQSGQFERSAA
jgi:hypothetical protein